jgi:pilus assembly protein CpaE
MESACLARVIGVLGGAGGAGTTTVACVLAAELRNRTDQPTLLIDLDSSPGLVSFAMGIEPQFTVQDLACNTSRLDLSLWEGMITHSPGSPDILASARAVTAPDSDAENLRTVVNFAANHYRWIVMDLGRLSPTSKKLLPAATDIILVSAQSISALHQCKHAIETIHDLGVEDDRVRLILNRIHEGQPLPRKELENLFGVPIAAVLPPAHEDLQDAYLDRRLPNVTGSFRIALGEVVRKMAGLPGEAPKWSRLSLTSLAERFRRRGEAVKASAAS